MPSQVHLLVLIHGMWGNPGHLAEMHRIINEIHVQPSMKNAEGDELRVFLPETNREESTYDGIDWGGERVAKEVYEEIEKVEDEGKKVVKFSVTGYSLGGLVARYVVGILHQQRLFETITPVNFNTIATPHIGLLVFPTVFSRIAGYLGPKLLSRTGEQFYGIDKWSERGRPLLEVMADPERVFYQGLSLFPHIRIYANAINDLTVPFITSAIEPENPFADHATTGLQPEFLKGYSPILKSWTVPPEPPALLPKPRPFTLKWFKSFNVPLPPVLQWRFPFNIVLIALLPVLFPTFISLVFIRFSLANHSSRSRIKLLEKEEKSSPKAGQRLIHIVAELEREMENMVADLADEPAPVDSSHLAGSGAGTKAKAKPPRFTPAQRRMIASLNKLPQLKKEFAFIDNVRNSHATIISRDVKNFEFHRIGWGVLHHWANSFII